MPAPLILLEVSPRRVADGVVEKLYLAGFGGTTPYFYDGKHWRGGLSTLPALVNALNFANGEFGSGGVPTAGALVWSPQKDADRQLLSAYVWEDAEAIVRIGTEGALPAGVMGRITSTQSAPGSLTLFFADVSQTLKVPVLTDRYAGTGGIEGPAEWEGRIKPRMFGRVWNVAGQPIDPTNNVYAFADPTRRLQSFDAIRDKGAAADPADLTLLAWQGSAAATFTALRNAAAPEGGGVLCPSIACVKWWTQPAGDLCVDLKGEIGAGYVESTAEIIERVVGIVGGPAMAAGTVAAAKAARPDPIGIAITQDGTTAAAVLDQYLGNVSLLWLIDAAGQIVIRQWAWGASAGSFTSHEAKRVETHRPTSTRKLGYKHNENVMARGDLAAIVLATDVLYPDGTPVSELQPAQPGADVTGDNTSKDTEAVGGVPADTLLQDIDTATAAASQAQADAATALQQATDAQTAIAAAQQDIIDNATEIQTVSQTVATQGGQITTLQSSVTANTGAISTLQTTVGTQGAAITVLQQASTTQAGQIATLNTAVTAGARPNLIPNGGFENGLVGWSYDAGVWSVPNSYGWGNYAYTNAMVGPMVRIMQRAVRMEPGVQLTLSGDMSLTVLSGTGLCYLDMIFRDSAGNQLADAPQVNKTGGDFSVTGADRDTYKCVYTSPANTYDVVVRFVIQANAGGSVQGAVRQMKLERGANITPFTVDASVTQAFSAISTTNTQVASLQTTVSTQGSSITANATAITTLQTQTATLTTQVTAGNPNILPNGGFENGAAGWSGAGFNLRTGDANGNYIRCSGNGTFVFSSDLFPVWPNTQYTIAAGVGFIATSGQIYVDLIFYDANNQIVLDGPQSPIGPNVYGGFITTGADRRAVAVTATSPSTAVKAQARCVVSSVSGNSYAAFRQIKVEQGPIATPYTSEASAIQSFTAINTTNTQVATLQSTVSTQGVTITQQQTAITTLNGNVATLLGRWGVEIDVSGYISGILLNNNGNRSDFTIRSDKFTIIAPGGGERTEYSNGNWRVYNSAGTLKVQWGINI